MFIDLSHSIESGMPFFPGTEPVQIANKFTIAKDGYAELILRMVSHTGTHIDAPRHIIHDGKTLDSYPVSFFIGQGLVLDLDENDVDPRIFRSRESELTQADFVLLRTNWAKKWGSPEYFEEPPVPSLSTVKLLCSHKLRGIGIDGPSIDSVRSISLDNHNNILGRGMIIMENLNNLHRLPATLFKLTALPLKVTDSDGFSARIVAEV